ncbi:hypothetical protein AcV5_003007 [Taiwanofungus camphoratus]|nr:hypothetical protein AcV5_003007 [Antrodia cinnamomea]
MSSTSASNPQLAFDPLPISQLESLKFKANQIIESIQSLQRTIEAGSQNMMPAWPDILSKYNVLLSQTHNISTSFAAPPQTSSGASYAPGNPYERLALHPSIGMTDFQLDNELIPLLRNQQTTDVLRLENDIVRHLSEHMASKGSLGVLTQAGRSDAQTLGRRTEYEDVLRECEQIRVEHDQRVDRAVRAVAMLREKYDWKARVAVDQEEPDELEWDPALQGQPSQQSEANAAPQRMSEVGGGGNTPVGRQSNDTDEEEELEEVLGDGADQTPDGTTGGGESATSMVEG